MINSIELAIFYNCKTIHDDQSDTLHFYDFVVTDSSAKVDQLFYFKNSLLAEVIYMIRVGWRGPSAPLLVVN